MSLEFSVEIGPSHVAEATRGVFWRQARGHLGLGLGALGLMLLAQLLLVVGMPAAGLLGHGLLAALTLATFALALLFSLRHYVRRAQRNFERFRGAPVRVRLEPEFYRYDAAWGNGALRWSEFQSLWRFRGVWVLLQHRPGGPSILLPAGALSLEARRFVMERLAGVGAQVRV